MKKKSRKQLWEQKYAPETLDEVVGHEDIISTLKAFVNNQEILNLMFVGPPGVGKTATALALARDFYGENWQRYTLDINTPDERGITTYRRKIKDFCEESPPEEIPHKLVIFDRAEHFVNEVQYSLCRFIETSSDNARYIFVVRDSTKLIEGIQSRVCRFNFTPLPNAKVRQQIAYIAGSEGLQVSESGFNAISRVAGGDLRKAITILQTLGFEGGTIDKERVITTFEKIYTDDVEDLIKKAYNGHLDEARTRLTEFLIEKGMSSVDLLRDIEQILEKNIIDTSVEEKIDLLELLREIDSNISMGATDYIQLTGFLAHLYELGRKST